MEKILISLFTILYLSVVIVFIVYCGRLQMTTWRPQTQMVVQHDDSADGNNTYEPSMKKEHDSALQAFVR